MSIEYIRSFIAQDMSIVDDVIREKLHSHVLLIRQVSEYIINSGGKRLRPAMVILSAGAFGYSGKFHYNLAAVVEFIHTATLLHDDVVDESELRRNKETANALFGNAASVLVGDFLYSRAFQMMVEVGDMRVMQVLADATNTIAEGEVLQLLNCRDPHVTEENYLQVIRYKTAKLFEAASRLGAILGNATPAEEEAMAVYGMHLGTAFQLIDDMLDYSGNNQNIGKNLGDDLAEGKPTLPLIYAMRVGTAEQASIIRKAIEDGGKDGFQPVLGVIQQTTALEYAKQCAEAEIATAIAAIASLPDSENKKCLLQLASFAITRNH
ncbi:octaprenyl diphosphate synthase [Nitrosomonas sp.]|uniref:octaprenyl diphosphate synthase n=1 Tax=Nitrosomonas sp. TaxID=42353 RepID=UPI00262E62AD|nr:octaprenyl diphosphate synthase [Nitrosomonas sp.]